MSSTRTSALENSAETQFAAPSNSEMSSATCKKRKANSSNVGNTTTGAGHVVKNNRTRYTAYQVEMLKKIFVSIQYPDSEQLETIAWELALEKYVVKVWFKNRRARQKTQGQENASRLFLQGRNSGLRPRLLMHTPVYYYSPVFPSPWQRLMNYHGHSVFGLYERSMNNANLFHNRYNIVHTQEPRSDDPVPCYQEDVILPDARHINHCPKYAA